MALQGNPIEGTVTAVTRSHLRRNIKALMGANGITQTRLAAEIGLSSQQVLSSRLRGGTPFDEDEIALIADFFRKEPSELLAPSTIWERGSGRRQSPNHPAVIAANMPQRLKSAS